MRRPAPARLRELRPNSHQQPRSLLSRVPLLHSSSSSSSSSSASSSGDDYDSVQDWAAGDQVPGFLIPLAFLSSLRANLQISTFEEIYSPAPLSIVNTPNPYEPGLPLSENRFLVDPQSSDNARTPLRTGDPTQFQWNNNDDEKSSGYLLPGDEKTSSVTTFFTKKEKDLGDALGLISESVAEQRQTAVKALAFHPCFVAVSTLVFLTSLKMLYTGSPSDLVLMMAVWLGYSIPCLFIIRFLVRGYHDISLRVGSWSWLSESSVSGVSHKRDEVLVAQDDNNNEIVGVLVLRMAKTVAGAGTPGVRNCGIRSRRKSSARWTGIIRAWAVRESDRGQGIGMRLLEEAVSNCRLRSLDGPIFADDHANATRVLPRVFNSVFDKQESWARKVLEMTIIRQRGR